MELATAEPRELVTLELTPKQQEFVEDALSGRYRYLALGGAIRGTKTFAALILLVILMRIFPGSRWAVVRSDLPTLRRNTIPSIEKIRATMGGWLGPLNQSTWAYTAANGSQLLLVGESISTDPDLDRFKGFEVNGFLLEEGNELSHKTFLKSIERAGAWVIPASHEQKERGESPEQPFPVVLVTFNPSPEWTDEIFHEPHELGTLEPPYYFLPLTILDNPFLTDEYRASLETLRTAAPQEYDRFVLGKRGTHVEPNQLIQASWLVAAREVEYVPGPKKEACDVARFGDDDTCFASIDGNALADLEGHEHWDTNATSVRAKNRLAERGIEPQNYTVDTVGLGAGVADNMRAARLDVREFVAGAKPVEREGSFWKFADLRSQAWWEFREKLRTNRFRLAPPPGQPPLDPKRYALLIKDLTAPRYEIAADKVIRVESKDDIKKRLGRSTDDGDAVVMAAFDPPARRRPTAEAI